MKKKSALKKAKKAAIQQQTGESSEPTPAQSSSRDFENDLVAYVTMWKDYKSSWKFNKILQTYALQHCLDKIKIGKNTFRVLLPYLASIQGGARDRLQSQMNKIIEDTEMGVEDADGTDRETQGTDSIARKESILKRAIQIRKILQEDVVEEDDE